MLRKMRGFGGDFPALRGRVDADVAIAGGGLTGLTIAVWLRRAGLRVAIAEGRTVGGGASAQCRGVVSLSGTRCAGIRKRFGMESVQAFADTSLCAFRAVRELADAASLWQTRDVLVHFSSGEAQVEKQILQSVGFRAETQTEMRLKMPGMGRVDPKRYLQLLEQLARDSGVAIFEHSRVNAMETNEIITEHGSIRAPYIVVATGYPILNVPGWYFLYLTQSAYAFKRVDAEPEICMAEDGSWMAADGQMWRRVGRVGTYAETAAGERLCGSDVQAPDQLPVIGAYAPKTPALLVAAAYGGRGLIGSMTAAQAISSRILGLPSKGYELYDGGRLRRDLKTPLKTGLRFASTTLAHFSAPRCPHLGGRLRFDPQTKLWQCPCHGSCFDDIGQVVTAPAVHEAVLRDRK